VPDDAIGVDHAGRAWAVIGYFSSRFFWMVLKKK